ncbi:hypothetical protein Tco_0685361, partial [Tanacetum coccineum]
MLPFRCVVLNFGGVLQLESGFVPALPTAYTFAGALPPPTGFPR